MSEPQGVDDGGRRVVEVQARTVDEAVARGLVRLGGLSRAEVKIEVLSEGKGGLLGFGAEQATVRLTELLPGESPGDMPGKVGRAEAAEVAPDSPAGQRDAPETGAKEARKDLAGEPTAASTSTTRRRGRAPSRVGAPRRETAARREVAPPPGAAPERESAPSDLGAPSRGGTPGPEAELVAREVVGELLRLLGYEDVSIELKDTLLPVDVEGESSLVLSVKGPGTERLLEQEARPLQALQFVSRLVVGRRIDNWVNLLLDVEGDRARRMQELFQLAQQSATLVEREGLPVSLPPMSAYERRVVHLALRDHPSIVTQSIGSGESRKVTVRRKDQILPEL